MKINGSDLSLQINAGSQGNPKWKELKCGPNGDGIAALPARRKDSSHGTNEAGDIDPTKNFIIERKYECNSNGSVKSMKINTGIRKDRWETVELFPYSDTVRLATLDGDMSVKNDDTTPPGCFWVTKRQAENIKKRCLKKKREEKENEE